MAQTLLKTLTFTGPIAANATAGSTALGANRVDVQGGMVSVTSANNLLITTEGAGGTGFYRDDLFLSDLAAYSTTKMVMTSRVGATAGDCLECKVMYQQGSRDGYAISTYLGSTGFFTVYKVTGSPVASGFANLGSTNFSPAYVAGHKYQAVIQTVGTPGTSTVITAAVFDLTANPGDPVNTTDANPVATATYTDTTSPFTTGQFAVTALNSNANCPLIRLYGSGMVAPLVTTSPSPYQVSQRNGITSFSTGAIAVAGKNQDVVSHSIEASFNGGAYQTVAANVAPNAVFSGSLTNQLQGQGSVTTRFVDTPATSVACANVGIGDVWVIAGQSNSSGLGTNYQIFLNGNATMGALFGNDYAWRTLADPTDDVTGQVDGISNDSNGQAAGTNTRGSVWPLVASQATAYTKVPVAFIPCALGGSRIAVWQPGTNHQDRNTLYGSMVYRALACGGVKGVLWWEGEYDESGAGGTQTPASTYLAGMKTIAAAIKTDLGVKLIPCKLQAFPQNLGVINGAIGQEWATDANVLPGPDLSDIPTDDAYHLMADAKILTASARWWAAIYKDFYAPAGGTKRRTQ